MALFFLEMAKLKNKALFLDTNEKQRATKNGRTVKEPQFSLISRSLRDKVWGISSPHISTYENLHAKQKPLFSVALRGFSYFFVAQMKLGCFPTKLKCGLNFAIQLAGCQKYFGQKLQLHVFQCCFFSRLQVWGRAIELWFLSSVNARCVFFLRGLCGFVGGIRCLLMAL